MFYKLINLIVFLTFAPFLKAQEKRSFLREASFSFQSHYGSFLNQEPKATFLKDSYSFLGEMNITAEATKLLPERGVALFFGSSGSHRYIGKIAAVSLFYDYNLFKYKKYSSGFKTAAGLSFIEKPYDIETNHKNVLLGSRLNIFIHALWKHELQLNQNFAVNAGVSFSHLSNGSIQLPNLGLNIPALSVGVKYDGDGFEQQSKIKKAIQDRSIKYSLFASAGVVQSPWINSPRSIISVANAEVTTAVSHNKKAGVGFAFFYDPSELTNEADPTREKIVSKNNLTQGIYASFEQIIGRTSIPLQAGIYCFSKNGFNRTFQNIGLRYKVTKHLVAGIYLKTHLGKADYIHAGVGYVF